MQPLSHQDCFGQDFSHCACGWEKRETEINESCRKRCARWSVQCLEIEKATWSEMGHFIFISEMANIFLPFPSLRPDRPKLVALSSLGWNNFFKKNETIENSQNSSCILEMRLLWFWIQGGGKVEWGNQGFCCFFHTTSSFSLAPSHPIHLPIAWSHHSSSIWSEHDSLTVAAGAAELECECLIIPGSGVNEPRLPHSCFYAEGDKRQRWQLQVCGAKLGRRAGCHQVT